MPSTVIRPPAGKMLDRLVAFAQALADESGKILYAANARRPLVELKPDRSLVTKIDRRIESRLRRLIRARFPGHGSVWLHMKPSVVISRSPSVGDQLSFV